MLKRCLAYSLVIIMFLMSACSSKEKEVSVTIKAMDKVISEDGKQTVSITGINSGVFNGTNGNYNYKFFYRIVNKIKDIDELPWKQVIENGRPVQGKYTEIKEADMKGRTLGKTSCKFYITYDGKTFAAIRKGPRVNKMNRFDIVLITPVVSEMTVNEKEALDIADKIYGLGKRFDFQYINLDNFKIKYNEVSENISLKNNALYNGELWAIASPTMLKQSKGYSILPGKDFVLKYRTGFDYSSFIEVNSNEQ